MISAFGGFYSNAQTTITLQPDSAGGKDAEIALIVPNNNYGNSGKCSPYAWTQNSILNVVRPLIEFDLSNIPANATITDAKFTLFYNPNYAPLTQHNGSNAFWIKRITSTWTENTVTWNTQPTTTSINQVSVPQSLSPTQDYIDIDVTALVQDMINNPATSFGFMLQLQNETPYADVMLASSDNIDKTLHPKIQITYTTNVGVAETINTQSIMSIYPNPFTSTVTLQMDKVLNDATLTVYNSFGQTVALIKNISGQTILFNRENLASGLYFVQLTEENEIIAEDKFVITDR